MAGSVTPTRLHALKELVISTRAGLVAGYDSRPTRGGQGGSHYMRDASGNRVAVFKPLDEEPNVVIEPPRELIDVVPLEQVVSFTPVGLKKGTKAGKGGYREVFAYLLDYPINDHPINGRRSASAEGFAGVPPTTFVSGRHRVNIAAAKLGSLQKYKVNDGHCFIDSAVCDLFPVPEVHKIAVLDIRFANADRNLTNILRSESNGVLIPIDHGYCFPSTFEEVTLDWLAWKQAKVPFTDETRNYIEKLDALVDIGVLKSYGLDMPLQIARIFRISTMLLKKGADRGLTPYDIGAIMCRKIPNILEKDISVIEEIVNIVEQESGDDIDEEEFLDAVSREMDRRLDEIYRIDEIGTPP